MSEEKSFPLSGKRRGELQQRGEVPRSQDVTSAALVATGIAMLLLLGPAMGHSIAEFMEFCFRDLGRSFPSPETSGQHLPLLPIALILNSAIFMLALVAAGLTSQIAQVGFVFSDRLFEPDWERFSPARGLKQLFSVRRTAVSVQALLKLGVILGACWLGMRELVHEPVFSRPVSVAELGGFLLRAAWIVGWRCALALAVLATADYAFQRWRFEKDHRMSQQELKDEFRQSEGPLEIKMKRRLIARKQSLRRMLENLQDATIVITNPTHYAVALRYQRGATPAPIVVAKGSQRAARLIRERCLSLAVPVFENPPLARGLYAHAEVGEAIPALYYQAVATVLAQLYRRGLRAAGEETP